MGSVKVKVIDFLINILEPKAQALPQASCRFATENGNIDTSNLTQEQREDIYREFSRGSSSLLRLYQTAHDHNMESMFSYSDLDHRYIMFKLTDDNINELKKIGKILSNEEIETRFENHYELGKIVSFASVNFANDTWVNKISYYIENPPEIEAEPSNYYHEEMSDSNMPFSVKANEMRRSLVSKLRNMY